jgi:predicted dehydrogenase
VGVIGAGWWATTNHIPVLAGHPDVTLVGVAGLGLNSVNRIRDEFGFEFGTEDFREVLEADVDAVVVSSPHDLHHIHAGEAVDRGLAVLCEKPMTLDGASSWDLVNRARRSGSEILIAYGWNYKPFADRARALLRDPGVGAIEFVSVRMASPTRDFFTSSMPTVPDAFRGRLVEPNPATWQTPSRGGGYAHGQLSHAAGLLFSITDLRAKTVRALTSGAGSSVDLYDAAILTFSQGAVGSVSGAATLPENDKFQIDIQIYGKEGVLLLDIERERLQLRRHGEPTIDIAVPAGEGDYECIQPLLNFIEIASKRQAPNHSDATVGAKASELVEAVLISAERGGDAVEIDHENYGPRARQMGDAS